MPALDPVQQAVVDRRSGSGPLVLVGAPGTGKTTTLVESVVARVVRDGLDPATVLVLAPTRVAASALRDRITDRLNDSGPLAVQEPLARTAASFAFGLIRRQAVQDEEPAPRLISGPEQDVLLRDLLAGHAAGDAKTPPWPGSVLPALALRGFRDELRDLLMRAMERGLAPQDLALLGQRTGRPEWVAAAQVFGEYLDVTALSTPGAYDPAAIVDHAAALLADRPELLSRERARWRLVAVDDHHESVEATARLLDQLCGRGADLLLTGDPDATTQSYRGAEPALVGSAARRHPRADGSAAEVVVLPHRWRSGPELTALAQRVAAGIGSAGPAVVQRRGASARPGPPHVEGVPAVVEAGRAPVRAVLLRSATAEAAYIAQVLRRAHLEDDRSWGAMAVVVRSAAHTLGLRRALLRSGVPVSTPTAEVPVRDEPAVRPLRWALRVCLSPEALDAETAVALLTSPLGDADALALRRLRQVLLAEERAGGGTRASDALLVEALADPVRLATLPNRVVEPAVRVARALQAGRLAASAEGATAELVLWALWDATGLASRWQRAALAGGAAGRRADRDLDAVVAVFEAAARFTDRLPGAGPGQFADQLDQQEVPADTLAERAPQDDVVALVTPQAAAGREWDLVVVAGLQDGVWPNTRLRGSLLGAPALVEAVAGRAPGAAGTREELRAARTLVLHDELRMLHVAVTRAREQVLATAVQSADAVPSPFLELIDPLPADAARPITPLPRAMSLPAVVAELRRGLVAGTGVPAAAALVALLAARGVPGAAPRDWYGLAGPSDQGPLRGADEQVRVSPSSIESFSDCPLRWLLQSNGGREGAAAVAGVGSLVHALAHEMPAAGVEEMTAALQARWPGLGLGAGWVGEVQLERARAMIARLVPYLQESQDRLVGTELEFEVQVGAALLKGRVDRLERDQSGRPVVVDLKTGRSAPTKADLPRHAQLGAYQAAAEAGAFREHTGGCGSGGARLVHVGGNRTRFGTQQQPPLADDHDPAWAQQMITAAAEGMSGTAFQARVQVGCRHCPVRASCPAQAEGRQVGT